MSLTHTLRIAAVLLILAAVFQYFVFDQLLIKTIVVAHIILALSFFSDNNAQRISIVSLGLAVVVPIGAWRTYKSGDSTLGFFVFDLVVFAYVAYIAFLTLKRNYIKK